MTVHCGILIPRKCPRKTHSNTQWGEQRGQGDLGKGEGVIAISKFLAGIEAKPSYLLLLTPTSFPTFLRSWSVFFWEASLIHVSLGLFLPIWQIDKGQEISERKCEVFKLPKIWTKNLKNSVRNTYFSHFRQCDDFIFILKFPDH